jgi:hypothetical protein
VLLHAVPALRVIASKAQKNSQEAALQQIAGAAFVSAGRS